MPITWPVFADEHGDLWVLADAVQLRSRIEAVDVERGEYVFRDAAGRVLAAVVQPDGRVGVQLPPDAPAEADVLAHALTRHLGAAAPADADLPTLVRLVADQEAPVRRHRRWWRRQR